MAACYVCVHMSTNGGQVPAQLPCALCIALGCPPVVPAFAPPFCHSSAQTSSARRCPAPCSPCLPREQECSATRGWACCPGLSCVASAPGPTVCASLPGPPSKIFLGSAGGEVDVYLYKPADLGGNDMSE